MEITSLEIFDVFILWLTLLRKVRKPAPSVEYANVPVDRCAEIWSGDAWVVEYRPDGAEMFLLKAGGSFISLLTKQITQEVFLTKDVDSQGGGFLLQCLALHRGGQGSPVPLYSRLPVGRGRPSGRRLRERMGDRPTLHRPGKAHSGRTEVFVRLGCGCWQDNFPVHKARRVLPCVHEGWVMCKAPRRVRGAFSYFCISFCVLPTRYHLLQLIDLLGIISPDTSTF